MSRRRAGLALLALAAGAPGAAAAIGLELAEIFGDGAVVQREVELPVWGRAAPGARVVVTFAGASASATADGAGRWEVELSPRPAGGPHRLRVESGGEALVRSDLQVGDVWLCSGQSNMEWVVADSRDAAAEIAATDDRAIRHFKVPAMGPRSARGDPPPGRRSAGKRPRSGRRASGAPANLFNRAGLPAAPFRTDVWRGGTAVIQPGSEATDGEAEPKR